MGEWDSVDGSSSFCLTPPVVMGVTGGVVDGGAPVERRASLTAWRGFVLDTPVVVEGAAVHENVSVLGVVDGCARAGTATSVQVSCRLRWTCFRSVRLLTSCLLSRTALLF